MRLIDLGYPMAKFTDVAVDPTGFVVVFEDAHSQQIVFCQFNPDGSPRARDTFIPVGRGNAFPRVHVWDGVTWLAYRHGEYSMGYLHNINDGVVYEFGVVYGNDPIAFGDGWVAAQIAPNFTTQIAPLQNPHMADLGPIGRPTGLAYVYSDGSHVVLVDDIRNIVPGMVNPRRAGWCIVGEADRDSVPCNIARLNDKRECILWPGLLSYTPRIAYDHRQYIVGTWGDGARLAMLEDADFLPVIVPPEPQPDTEFVPNPEGLVTPRQMHAFLKATATACIARDGGTLWWLHKSGERPDWGEWWFERDGYLGLLEDRSTGYRDCPDGVRRAPEDCAAAGYDAATLPLSSYYWDGEEGYLWAPMSTEGAFNFDFYVDYVWSNGDVWADVPVWISLEPGTGITGGYPVFCRQTYVKREGEERNLWGESGWRRHTDTHSGLDVVNAAPAPAFPRGPFVEPRRTTPYPPIYQPLNTEPPTPEPPVPGYPDLAPIPRDQILDTLTWLRNEVYLPDGWEPTPVTLVHHTLDDEGIAAWLCDAYESVARYKYGMSHQKAKDYVYAEIAKVVKPPQPTMFRGPIEVEGRDFVS